MSGSMYVDACESHRERVLAEPLMAVPDGDGGLIAAYRCPRCGREWTCGWGIQASPQLPVPPATATRVGDLLDGVLARAVRNRTDREAAT